MEKSETPPPPQKKKSKNKNQKNKNLKEESKNLTLSVLTTSGAVLLFKSSVKIEVQGPLNISVFAALLK